MLGQDVSYVAPEASALLLRTVGELDGGNEHPGNTPALKIVDVVHTARRAGTSIG